MLISSHSLHPKPGRWTILTTWALVTISISSCQSAGSPTEPSIEILELDPVAATLVDGDTVRIQVLSKVGNAGAALNPSAPVAWKSSDPEIAVVEDGLIRGIGPGEARVTAIAGSGAEASADITVMRAAPGPAEEVSAVSGDSQSGAPGETLGDPLVVNVTDASGDPVPGVLVSWAVAGAGGALEPLAETTNDQGNAAAVWTLGEEEGEPTASATVEGAGDVAFTAVIKKKYSPPPSPSHGMIRAFPGAEGWGATALNESRGLPLRVHFVTSREATGSGTLKEAIESTSDDHYDVIIFRTGGAFTTVQPDGIRLNSSHVYIAGQTAPGDGVALVGDNGDATISFRGHGENISDVVLRFVRIHAPRTGVSINKGDRIVLDHLSVIWGRRYLLNMLRYEHEWSHPISNVSVQNSLFAEALSVHPTAVVIGASTALKPDGTVENTNVSLHRNLFASNDRRNPQMGTDNSLLANNVVYNWRLGAFQAARRGVHDFVSNVGKAGPMGRSDHIYTVNPHCNHPDPDYSIYAAGNIGPASNDSGGDNWQGSARQVACYHGSQPDGEPHGAEAPEKWKRSQAQEWATIPFPVEIVPAAEAYDLVLGDVGASARLTCDGNWVAAVDAVDARIISDTKGGRGPSSAPEAAGSSPVYTPGAPCPDTDGDGLPDAWEERFFQCTTCAAPGDIGRDGYLRIEHYLNGTRP